MMRHRGAAAQRIQRRFLCGSVSLCGNVRSSVTLCLCVEIDRESSIEKFSGWIGRAIVPARPRTATGFGLDCRPGSDQADRSGLPGPDSHDHGSAHAPTDCQRPADPDCLGPDPGSDPGVVSDPGSDLAGCLPWTSPSVASRPRTEPIEFPSGKPMRFVPVAGPLRGGGFGGASIAQDIAQRQPGGVITAHAVHANTRRR